MAEKMGLLSKLFRDKVSKLKDKRMSMESEFDVGYSTGFLNFDFRNGMVIKTKVENKDIKYYSVGITDGSMVMVIGRSGCGKTTFVNQTAGNIVRPFETSCIFEDSIEAGINIPRLHSLLKFTPEEIDSRLIIRNAGVTAENFYERIKMIHDMKLENRETYEYDTGLYDFMGKRIYKLEPTVYILDSLALLMPEKYADEDELSGQMSATAMARTNASIFKRITPMLKAANIILFVINHVNQKVEINPMMHSKAQVAYLKAGETLPGGNAPIYLSNMLIRFDDSAKLKAEDTFGIDGSIVDVSFIKSRSNKAGGEPASLVFNQEEGFDADLSLFIMLKNAKLVNGAGAYLYLGDRSDMKFAQKNFKKKLYEDPEFRQVFMDEAIKYLKSQLDADDEEKEQSKFISLSSAILSQINNMECIPEAA